ncbi:ribonuclease P protein component [Acetobacteraceae bacterium]|nr:ribonuclease P protein component [Acetobacteraceae bacterium]
MSCLIYRHLQKRSEFLRAAARGVKAVRHGVVIQAYPSALPVGVGFTVTRKLGNAVVRNRIRRRLRAAFQEVVKEVEVPAGDYVLIGRKTTDAEVFLKLVADIKSGVLACGKKMSANQTK